MLSVCSVLMRYFWVILGYVLDCLPSFDTSWKNVCEQIEFLKSLKQPPDVIINLKVSYVESLNTVCDVKRSILLIIIKKYS